MCLGFDSRVCRLTDESSVRLKRLGFRLNIMSSWNRTTMSWCKWTRLEKRICDSSNWILPSFLMPTNTMEHHPRMSCCLCLLEMTTMPRMMVEVSILVEQAEMIPRPHCRERLLSTFLTTTTKSTECRCGCHATARETLFVACVRIDNQQEIQGCKPSTILSRNFLHSCQRR
jgi:hypothetical protein